jgi:integrase
MAQKSHIKQRITRSVLKTLAPREKAFVAWDSEVKGFGVRVQPGGSLSYVAVHRLTGAKNASWIVLGKVSELTPEIARDRARAAIVAARDGRHVGEEARERGRKTKAASAKPDAILVITAVQKYLHHLEVEVSERTGRRRSEATLRASKLWLSGLSDTFGRMTLEALTAEHVRQVIASAAPSSKRNVAGAVARLMSWTVECGYLKLNPCANVRRPRAPAARTRTPSVDEVRRIRAACDDLMAEGAWTRVQHDTVLTLLLTGQRRSEVTEMQWQDLSWERELWTQPEIRNKAHRLHEVPLSPVLLDLLKDHHARAGRPASGRVFPAVRSGESMGPWMADAVEWVRERTKIDFRWHDVRRAMVTALADHDVPIDVADAVLNHARSATVSGITAVYQHAGLMKQKRRAMVLWSELVTGFEPASNVVRFAP